MITITRHQVDLNQGQDEQGRNFGYVAGDAGGYFFTWMTTLESTLDSIEEDEQDGDGGLDKHEVNDFLAAYLPSTPRGRRLWELTKTNNMTHPLRYKITPREPGV